MSEFSSEPAALSELASESTELTAASPVLGMEHLTLRGRRLPTWSFFATGIAVVAATYGVTQAAGIQSRSEFGVLAVIAYLAVQSAIAYAVEGARHARDRLAMLLVGAAFLIALIPLIGVLGYTLAKGVHRFDGDFLTHSMRGVAESDNFGGAYHAIVGTVEQVGIATVIAVPFGVLVAVYLAEYSRGRFGTVVSLFVDVMTGLPSIVAGLFVYALLILELHQRPSGLAGALALSLLMLPTIVRATEEMLKLVPVALREGSLALGVPKWKTILWIVIPTALPGIMTGVMLAIARVIGETAPILLTVAFASSINVNPFTGAQGSLPLMVFDEAQQPFQAATDRAWAGALTLIIIVMVLSVVARVLSRFASARG